MKGFSLPGLGFVVPALAFCGMVGCAGPQEQLPPQGPPILKAEQPPVIDGVLDDPCWKEEAAVRVDYLHGKEAELADPPRMVAKYAWDEHYLYIAYETFDRNLVARSGGEKQGPPGNQRLPAMNFDPGDPNARLDVVEFFISFGDRHHFWEVHQNAANHFHDIWVIPADPNWPLYNSSMTVPLSGNVFFHEAYIQDDGNDTVATAVKLKPKADGKPSTVNDANDADSGYTGEIRLPWSGIGAPNDWRAWYSKEIPGQKEPYRWPGPWSRIAGREIILLAACQNGDCRNIYTHSSPRRIPGWFNRQFDAWARYRLISRRTTGYGKGEGGTR